MIELGPNRYGKSAIRLVKVTRGPDAPGPRPDRRVALEGDFDAAHTDGDNAHVVATDTMKNTVYAFAPEHLTGRSRRSGGLASTSSADAVEPIDRSRSASIAGSRSDRTAAWSHALAM